MREKEREKEKKSVTRKRNTCSQGSDIDKIDGWVDEWIDGRMDGWEGRSREGWMNGCLQ